MEKENYFDAKAARLKAAATPAPRATPLPSATPAPRATPPPSATPAPTDAPVASNEVFVPPDVDPRFGIGALAAGGYLAKKFGPGIVSGVVRVAPKIIAAPFARGIAGLGTTILGNKVVDYYAPEGSTGAQGVGRGVGLVASGALGGYVAGGPAGAIAGAVGNPSLDVYKTYRDAQKNEADAQKVDAETAAMLKKDPSANRLKNRAAYAKYLQNK